MNESAMEALMIETSLETGKLDAALAKAQGEIEAASKDKVNPHFRSKYADLTAVWGAIRPALSKHGIAITQWPIHSDDGRLHIVTRMAHSGEWIRARFSIPVTKADAHGYGSAVTYAKRFSLAAAVGVVADDDDDGNGAAAKPSAAQRPYAAPHTASSDIEKQLTKEEKAKVDKVVSVMTDWLNSGDRDALTNAVMTMDNAGLENDEKIYAWTFFDSTTRTAMKKEHERLRKVAADKLLPQQA